MSHFLYNLKITFKNKELIFWTFAFPIILVTLFYSAFSGIKTAQDYEPIKIAVLKNENNQLYKIYENILNGISVEDSENQVFKTEFTDKNTATEKLNNEEVEAIVVFNDTDFPKLTVRESSISQTIIQNVMTEIEQSIIAGKQLEPSSIKNTYQQKSEYTMIEYFSLLAMACLYGAMIVTKALDKSLANMTASGKRIAVASISKAKIILSTLVTSYTTQLIGLAILFSYMYFILGIDFGGNIIAVILHTCLGALVGLSLGMFVSTMFKTSENNKDGIVSGFTMIGCFCAGMMGPQMKYVIDLNLPFLNKINPTAIITDGYYAITTYGIGERLWFDVASLILISLALNAVSIVILRRQKYDNL